MTAPEQLDIKRCRDCKHFSLGTITKPCCKIRTGDSRFRHPMNKICKEFEPKPVHVKKELKN